MKKRFIIMMITVFILMLPLCVNANEIKIGDEIKIGSESFYVIDIDKENLKLFAKYNLYVGDKCYHDGKDIIECTSLDTNNSEYGKQSILTYQNYYYDKGDKYGYVKYSNDGSVGYSTSNIVMYVNNYVDYLNNTYNINATGKLIETNELLQLGCSNLSSYNCNDSYDWIFDTSYWTGTPNMENIGFERTIGSDNIWGYCLPNLKTFGVRPVIMVNINNLDNYLYSYKFISEESQTFVEGSIDDYKIEIDGNYNLFDELVIDDLLLIKDIDYTISGDLTIIEFTESGINKLNSLKVGTYDVIIRYTNEKNVVGKLIIKEKENIIDKDNSDKDINTDIEKEYSNKEKEKINEENIKNPNTYDGILIYILLYMISFIGILYIIRKESNTN